MDDYLKKIEILETLSRGEAVLPSFLQDDTRWLAFETITFEPSIVRALCRYNNGALLLHALNRGYREPNPHGHPRNIAVHVLEGSYMMRRGYCEDGIPGPQGAAETISAGMCYVLLTNESHTIEVLTDKVLSVCFVDKRVETSAQREEVRFLSREEKKDHLAQFKQYYLL